MTPTETTTILRQFIERCVDCQFDDPRRVMEAIDAAVEMIGRLEAAESDALEQARLNGMGSEREAALMAKLEKVEKERDALRTELNEIRYGVAVAHDTIKALRAKIEAMERQEPVAWTTKLALDLGKDALGFHVSTQNLWGEKGVPLYTLPGAKGEEN